MTAAYAMLVNGGKRIQPSLIDRVQDKGGRTVWRHDMRDCDGCEAGFEGGPPPKLPDNREQIVDPISAYQIVSMLEGVVQRGTGVRLRELGITVGGKTGTTNDYQDAWFVGFSPDLAIGVYIGFDNPRTLGAGEAGSKAALPIWKSFAEEVFEGVPDIPFRRPDGVSLVRIVHDTGRLAQPGDQDVIWEAFKPGSEPTSRTAYEVLDPEPYAAYGVENPYAPGANPYGQPAPYQGQDPSGAAYQQLPVPEGGSQTGGSQSASQPGFPQQAPRPQGDATAGGLY
jgi:penicillin-binding protein 1A